MVKLFIKLEKFYDKMTEMDSSLIKTTQRLSKLPDQLDSLSNSVIGLNTVVISQKEALSNSITELNKVVNSQKEGFEKNTSLLNLSVGSLSKSIGDYEKNINNYSNQLNKIVDATDKQLDIWEKQQEIVKKEYSRRPKFEFGVTCHAENNKITFTSIDITNTGDIKAEVSSFSVYFKKDLFKITDTKNTFEKKEEYNSFIKYQITELGEFIPKLVISFKIEGTIENYNKSDLFIPFRLIYSSQYEPGTIESNISINCLR